MSIATIGLGRSHACAVLNRGILGPEHNYIGCSVLVRIRSNCGAPKSDAA
jgi:hypothetical protein